MEQHFRTVKARPAGVARLVGSKWYWFPSKGAVESKAVCTVFCWEIPAEYGGGVFFTTSPERLGTSWFEGRADSIEEAAEEVRRALERRDAWLGRKWRVEGFGPPEYGPARLCLWSKQAQAAFWGACAAVGGIPRLQGRGWGEPDPDYRPERWQDEPPAGPWEPHLERLLPSDE